MKCPCCGSHFDCRGENREDYHCANGQCPSRKEAGYSPHVGVRNNWWFATKYHLPFKRGDQWFCVVGPKQEYYKTDLLSLAEQLWPRSTQRYEPHQTTVLQQITPRTWSYPITSLTLPAGVLKFNTCDQHTLWTVDYMALPVNEDFNREFDALLQKFDRYLNKLMVLR